MLLLYLDPYLLGDPLFLTQLARDLAHRSGGAVLLHGSGEAGERALEATGATARQREGVWDVQTPEQAEVIERATRELNRQIVHELNEAGVPAIRVIGADRGLLKRTEGHVTAGRADWLAALIRQGVVGVVATLVEAGADELAEVDGIVAVAALATELDVPTVTLLASGTSPAREAHDATLLQRLRDLDVSAERVRREEIRAIPAS